MCEVKGLSGGDKGLDVVPRLRLGSIRKQVHDDGTLVDSLLDGEKGLTGNESVLDSLLPRSTVLTDTNNDVKTLVSGVESLTSALGTVAEHTESVGLEVLLQLLNGPVGSLPNLLGSAGEVNGLDTSDGL